MGARYSVRIKDKKSKPAKYDRFVWTADEARLVFGRAIKGNPYHLGPGSDRGGEFTTPELDGMTIVSDRLGNKVKVTEKDSLYKFMIQRPDGTWGLDPARERVHQKIINELLEGVKPQNGDLTLYMTGGGPASGKSTALKDGVLPGEHDAVVVDPDTIKTMLPGWKEMLEAGGETRKNAAGYFHEESSLIRKRLESLAVAGNYNVVLDTTGNNDVSSLASNLSKYRKAGYTIKAYYASNDVELAIARAKARGDKPISEGGGRYVAEPKIRETHANVSRTFPKAAAAGLFDTAELYDTNGKSPTLVATVTGNKTTIVNQELWDTFIAKGDSGYATAGKAAKGAAKGVSTTMLEKMLVAILAGVPKESMQLKYARENLLWDALVEDLKNCPKGQMVDIGNELSLDDLTNLYSGPLAEHETKKTAGQFGHESVQWVPIKKTNDEKQIVYGEVYAPYVLDTYGEFMTPEDIELMAHRFMRLNLSEVIDTQHDNKPNGSYPVESFIAREGDTEYTPGSWVLGVHIPDAELWTAVKSGLLNGFSFQSLVKPTSVDVEVEAIRDFVGETELSEDHQHTFYVELDEIGNVVGGRTSKGADGHYHEIQWASVTGRTNGHSHRFFL